MKFAFDSLQDAIGRKNCRKSISVNARLKMLSENLFTEDAEFLERKCQNPCNRTEAPTN